MRFTTLILPHESPVENTINELRDHDWVREGDPAVFCSDNGPDRKCLRYCDKAAGDRGGHED